MTRPTDIRIRSVTFRPVPLTFRTPLKFGGRVVRGNDILNVIIEAETASGRVGRGLGSMPLGNIWAWPSNQIDGEQSATAVRNLCQAVANEAGKLEGFAHPLDHVHQLHSSYRPLAHAIVTSLGLAENIPDLAVLLAASPVDAALHDAFGHANGINAFNGLSSAFMSRDLAAYLGPEFAGEYLDAYTLREPKPTMPLYHLVGALDAVRPEEVATPVGDGLPEHLAEWIAQDGLTHFKIKLSGERLDWDLDRVLAVDGVASTSPRLRQSGIWHYSLDFNERCEHVSYVLELLAKLRERAPRAFDRIQYIEQPTHRDLRAHPENRMHEAARIKPVVIDESLVDLDSLRLAMELGYSGVALKACKGHTEALLLGAAAQKWGLFLCVQDLTCPGASFLHSAELAARIPTVAAIEGNGRQYCPAGNVGWAERYPSMFHITEGTVGTHALTAQGLGHTSPLDCE